ncbi:MAG: hypothetical protein K5668_11110 [Lachnospiraceae bacterium]|nr:hypothetical protein [Lachnospiraceae bacterium]
MDFVTYSNYIGNREYLYFLCQFLAILGLFAAGIIPIVIIRKRLPVFREILFAYPLGISIYGVLGFLLLITGVRFSVQNIIMSFIVLTAGLTFYGHIKPAVSVSSDPDPESDEAEGKTGGKEILLFFAALAGVAAVALLSCSGILSQYVTNDSVYYYSMYPSILVKNGFITASLDKYLTDVGQTTAVIQCLPFLLGFDQSFGIQHFLNINFLLIFFTALHDTLCKPIEPERLRLLAAALGTFLLAVSEPFIVLSKWVLSNVYFMDFLFIVFYLEYRAVMSDEEDRLSDIMLFFMTSFLIMSRMEGGVLVFVMAAAFSALPMKKEKLILHFALPLIIMELGYYGMVFMKIGVDPLYSFLDMKAALLMAGMIAILLVYIILIRDRINISFVPVLLLAALLAGNAGLLLINHERYLTNIKAFILNIRQGNGWGLFPAVILIYAVIFIIELVKCRLRDIPVPVFLPAVLVLAIIAVCFARGGVLAVRTSDSGNRVLMEMVPCVLFSVYVWGISAV